jgi:hypothetical protein
MYHSSITKILHLGLIHRYQMPADSSNEIPVGGPLEVQSSTPVLRFTQETPNMLENSLPNSTMPLHQLIRSKVAPKPKKRKWCCNELVILLSAL